MLQGMRNLPHKGVLLTDYLNPIIANLLRDMNIPFLDAAGNAFLNEPPIYVFITGNKPQARILTNHKKPFHAAGLKVIFLLLCKPELADVNYREIARLTGVALGTVGKVMEELRARKNLIKIGDNKLQLANMKALLQEWVMLYPTVLKPKLFLGRYTAPTEEWWNHADLPADALWGGEIAAAKLTNYLKPAAATVYTQGKLAGIVVKNRLKEDNMGNIEILQVFWDRGLKLNIKDIVHPILAYADLLATGDPRNIEGAEILYEKELARHIEKI